MMQGLQRGATDIGWGVVDQGVPLIKMKPRFVHCCVGGIIAMCTLAVAAQPSGLWQLPDESGSRDSVMTLDQIVRSSLQFSPLLRGAEAAVIQAQTLTDAARAGYYPQLSAGVGYGNRVQNRSSQTLTVGVSQMLYDFGKTGAGVAVAGAQASQAQFDLEQQTDAVAQATAEAAVRVHLQQQLVRIAEERVGAVALVQDLARDRATAGLSSQVDAIQAQARLEAARAEQWQALAQLDQARELLRAFLDQRLPPNIADLPEPLQAYARLDLDRGIDDVPALRVARAELAAATAGLKQARAQAWPTLQIDASVERDISGRADYRAGEEGDVRWLANVSWATQGNLIRQRIRSALYAQQQAAWKVNSAELSVGSARNAIAALLKGDQKRLGELDTRRNSITQVRELYREQYKLGTRSILDTLNAEQEFYQAEADLETVRHEYWLRLVGYVGATGQTVAFYGLDARSPGGAP